MTIELTQVKAVKSDGIVWLIKGNKVYMTDQEGSFFNPFSDGSETYRYVFNKVSKLKPLPESERINILSKIKKCVDELM
jgi:sulfur transfer protein SufE